MNRRIAAGLVAVMALIAGTEFHRCFGWSPVLWPMVGATSVPLVLALACHKRRLGVAAAGAVSVVAAVLYLSLAVAGSAPGPGTLRLIGSGVVDGWAQILSSVVPTPDQPAFLLAPVALTWAACLVGAELVLRTRRGLVSVLPPIVAFSIALTFGIDLGGSRLPAAAALVALTSAVALLLRPTPSVTVLRMGDERGQGVPTGTLSGAAVVVIAAVVAAVVGPTVTGGRPLNLRSTVTPAGSPFQQVNPLAQLAGWAQQPATPLFTVSAAEGTNWQLAAFDHWDDQVGWTASTTYQASGDRLPSPSQVPRGTRLLQTVTIQQLGGVWLPAAATPTAVQGIAHPLVDASGELAAGTALSPGQRFQVTSDVPAPVTSCANDTVASDPADLSTAGLPPTFTTLATQIVNGASSPCEEATQLASYLRSTRFQFQPTATSGSSLPVLTRFLAPPAGQAGAGTSEQFAAAFALLGRALGLPTRMVLGFRPGSQVGSLWQVTAANALAWPEVDFAGIGWVGFDPTPVPGHQLPPTPPPPSHAKASDTPAGGLTAPPPPARRAPYPTHRSTGSGLLLAVLVPLLVLTALSGLALAARLGRRRRRARRASAAPPVSVVGAWWEALDLVRERGGTTVPASGSASETAATVVERIGPGGEPLRELASAVNAVLFGGWDPRHEGATRAWVLVDRLSAGLGAHGSRWHRFRNAIDLRPLWSRDPAIRELPPLRATTVTYPQPTNQGAPR